MGTIFTRALVTRTVIAGPVVAGAAITVAIIPATTLTVIAGAIITGPVVAGALITALIAVITAIIVALGIAAVAVHAVIIIAVTAIAAFGLAITMIAQNAEIMFGVLQIIFCRHPIAGLLGITRQSTIFFQKLGGIAALAIIKPGAIIVAASHLLRARTGVAASTPPPLVVPDQDRCPR